MKSEDLAYLAGVIDCDGYITIHRAKKNNAGRCKPMLYHSLKVGIGGTRTEPHDLAIDLFGGSRTKYTPKDPRHKAQYQWAISGPTAEAFLQSTMPFLRIKKEQAEIGLEFQRLLTRHRAWQRKNQKVPYTITDVQLEEREDVWAQIVVLNSPRNQRSGRVEAMRRLGRKLDGRIWDEWPVIEGVEV